MSLVMALACAAAGALMMCRAVQAELSRRDATESRVAYLVLFASATVHMLDWLVVL